MARSAAPRRPPGWRVPGPPPAGDQGRDELRPADDETLSYLCGDWRLFQKQRGHRWSVDDLLTAWLAAELVPSPADALDLGCGAGSVLLLLAFRCQRTNFVGVEAQVDRAALARRSIAYNGVEHRCRVVTGDFREFDTDARFELLTGTPPYFPIGTGTESALPHAAPCRFEHRGGAEAYLATAQRLIRPSGTFVMCTAALERPRVEAAARALGWHLARPVSVTPREGKAPLIIIDAFRPQPGAAQHDELTVRDRHGQWTPRFSAVRTAMGLPPSPH